MPSDPVRNLKTVMLEGAVVLAYGDFNSDRSNDLFCAGTDAAGNKTLEVWLWNAANKSFAKGFVVELGLSQSWLSGEHVVKAILPSDYNGDGRLDVLLSFSNSAVDDVQLMHRIYVGDGESLTLWLNEDALPKTNGEPTLVDMFGNLESNLLIEEVGSSELSVLRFSYDPLSPQKFEKLPFSSLVEAGEASAICRKFVKRHSNGVADFDGDCRPDICLTCEATSSFVAFNAGKKGATITAGDAYLEFWVNGGKPSPSGVVGYGYSLGKQLPWPKISSSESKVSGASAGLLTFGDLDGDGSIDLILPSDQNEIHIFYNLQRPLCSGKGGTVNGVGDAATCRPMCHGDRIAFGYDVLLESGFKHHNVLRIAELAKSADAVIRKEAELVLKAADGISLPIRIGDFNLDGLPDILVTVNPSPSQGTWTDQSVCRVLSSDCNSPRSYKFSSSFPDVVSVRDAAFFVSGQSGQTEIMMNVQSQDSSKNSVHLACNSLYQDAFFLKMTGFNSSPGLPLHRSSKRYGVSYSGMCFAFSFVDISGHLRIRNVSQYSQTSSRRLPLPEAFIGLGKMNTFVETFYAGIPLLNPAYLRNATTLFNMNELSVWSWNNRIIPNSNLYVRPPRFVQGHPDWSIELHINPSQYTFWILISLSVSILVLGITVLVLRRIEMLEDRKEKKSSLHIINFDAL